MKSRTNKKVKQQDCREEQQEVSYCRLVSYCDCCGCYDYAVCY